MSVLNYCNVNECCNWYIVNVHSKYFDEVTPIKILAIAIGYGYCHRITGGDYGH